ncbi:hypothetical protein BV898_15125 [Hypsibius exemplaris]|uniref:Receptor ligand binding region domain-containing protein n=1 Tax=Hypsibius exemplaris TaxID=2072580 RepID=A0A9X6RK29_HYPEX|nr:hypothetical protein BV898_15125 [Hypsibius exemplaris]
MSAAKSLVFIVSLPYNASSAVDIALTGPAFDMAAEVANRKYRDSLHVSVDYVYNETQRTCDEISSRTTDRISRFHYRKSLPTTCYAVVSTSNAFIKDDFWGPPENLATFPAVAAGGSNLGYTRAVLDVLSFYEWYHVTVLIETKTFTPFYMDAGNALRENVKLIPRYRPFSLSVYAFEYVTNDTAAIFLKTAKRTSRVMILLTLGSNALLILVFINLQPTQKEGSYGTASQFSYRADDASLLAFRSLLFISYRPAGSEFDRLNEEIAQRTQRQYNLTYSKSSKPLDNYAVQSSYDMVELLAAATNETFNSEDSEAHGCSGLQLVKALTNRTFTISTGKVYINDQRTRNLDLNIFGFNASTRELQIIGTYEWVKGGLLWRKESSIRWPTFDQRPPPDIPVCGFSGSEGPCAAGSTVINATTPSVVLVLVLCGLICFTRWQWMAERRQMENWWRLGLPLIQSCAVSGSSQKLAEKSALESFYAARHIPVAVLVPATP